LLFVGAFQGFEEVGFRWQKVAGTSAGAVASALVTGGYKAGEMREVDEYGARTQGCRKKPTSSASSRYQRENTQPLTSI